MDVASVDALFSCLGTHPSAYAMLGMQPDRTGSRDQITAPANVFKAKDRYVYIHAGTNALFARLCDAMGSPDLAADSRFVDETRRNEHVGEVEAIVSDWVARRTVDEVAGALTAAGVPYGPVSTIADVVGSPQIAARDMLVEVEHPAAGVVTLPGMPIKMTASPGAIHKPPPMVGEDNDAVYGGLLGLDAERLAQLRARGVI